MIPWICPESPLCLSSWCLTKMTVAFWSLKDPEVHLEEGAGQSAPMGDALQPQAGFQHDAPCSAAGLFCHLGPGLHAVSSKAAFLTKTSSDFPATAWGYLFV